MQIKKRPILRRAWDFIAVTTITPLGKVARRRIAVCCGSGGGGGGGSKQLVLFRRSRRLSLLRHYNYHFIGECEFSPESTPLFPRSRWGAPKRRGRILRLLLCGGDGGRTGDSGEEDIGGPEGEWGTLSAGNMADEVGQEPPEASEDCSEDDESVDRRADRFIERFYEEMRIQRQHSAVEYKEMLDRSC